MCKFLDVLQHIYTQLSYENHFSKQTVCKNDDPDIYFEPSFFRGFLEPQAPTLLFICLP